MVLTNTMPKKIKKFNYLKINILKMKKKFYLGILSTIFFISCNNEKPIPITEFECKYLNEKDGIIFNKSEKFSGSCITIFEFDGDYDFNGKINEVRTYKNGLRHGVWAKYYKNGELEYKGACKNGLIHGEYLGYYENGQLKERGVLNKGYRDGEWLIYNIQGKLIRKELHKNKKLIADENF